LRDDASLEDGVLRSLRISMRGSLSANALARDNDFDRQITLEIHNAATAAAKMALDGSIYELAANHAASTARPILSANPTSSAD
jgi:hypothetical protein